MKQILNCLESEMELWNLYSRKEEWQPAALDKHNRFSHMQSSNKNIVDPIVSRYLLENETSPIYPDNKRFAICLTHDVDEIYVPQIHKFANAKYFAKAGKILDSCKSVCSHYPKNKRSPYWNFNQIIELEEKYGATSSFYFMATDKDILRFRYDIEDLNGELGTIADRGWEVGLHGGYYAYNDFEEIVLEKNRIEEVLGKKVVGYRNHYLRFQYPLTMECLEKAGFLYDTTLGYESMIGFRNGMCHPFHPYNPHTNELMNIIEIPMALMDGALFTMTTRFDDAWQHVKQMIDTVSELNGVLCVNWHSNDFNCPFKENWVKMYERILDYGYQMGAWMTNGNNIANYVKGMNI